MPTPAVSGYGAMLGVFAAGRILMKDRPISGDLAA